MLKRFFREDFYSSWEIFVNSYYKRGYLKRSWDNQTGPAGVVFFDFPLERFFAVESLLHGAIPFEVTSLGDKTIVNHNFEPFDSYIYNFLSTRSLPGQEKVQSSFLNNAICMEKKVGEFTSFEFEKVIESGQYYILDLKTNRDELTLLRAALCGQNRSYDLPGKYVKESEMLRILFYSPPEKTHLSFYGDFKKNGCFDLKAVSMDEYFSELQKGAELWRF